MFWFIFLINVKLKTWTVLYVGVWENVVFTDPLNKTNKTLILRGITEKKELLTVFNIKFLCCSTILVQTYNGNIKIMCICYVTQRFYYMRSFIWKERRKGIHCRKTIRLWKLNPWFGITMFISIKFFNDFNNVTSRLRLKHMYKDVF